MSILNNVIIQLKNKVNRAKIALKNKDRKEREKSYPHFNSSVNIISPTKLKKLREFKEELSNTSL